jgi:hypothetical protein
MLTGLDLIMTLRHRACGLLGLLLAVSPVGALSAEPTIEIWDGDVQRIGHLGDAQDDLNLRGHLHGWQEVDQFTWARADRPHSIAQLSFRAYRRLAEDGDFNADIPIGMLEPGPNGILLKATMRDGRIVTRTATIIRETGTRPLPVEIAWGELSSPHDVGQTVDGRWVIEDGKLRTAQVGYDRIFLIGTRDWQDYEVRTSVVIHRVAPPEEAPPYSGGNGLGIIFRFTGHVTGGPFFFPSGQPKWGYVPLGGITWLRWRRGQPVNPPLLQFLAGDRPITRYGEFPVRTGIRYELRASCETLPDSTNGEGVTRYRFRIWPAADTEPDTWAFEHVLASATALRKGGLALLAHHVDASFGDVSIVRR